MALGKCSACSVLSQQGKTVLKDEREENMPSAKNIIKLRGRTLDVVRKHRKLAAELVEIARQVQVGHVLAAVRATSAQQLLNRGHISAGLTHGTVAAP